MVDTECSEAKHAIVENAAWQVALIEVARQFSQRLPLVCQERVRCPDCDRTAVAKYEGPKRTTFWE